MAILKKTHISAVLMTVLLAGCGNDVNSSRSVVEVDISGDSDEMSGKYPFRDTLIQSAADMEYVVMETTPESVFSDAGDIQYVGKDKIMVVANNSILFFGRDGRFIRRINKQGGSAREYNRISNCCYDPLAREVFVHEGVKDRILVYDDEGVYKRTLDVVPSSWMKGMVSLNDSALVVYYAREGNDESLQFPFHIISKKDGRLIKRVPVSIAERIQPFLMKQDEKGIQVITIAYYPVVKSGDRVFLTEVSNDTVFRLDPAGEITPVVVRTPGVQGMEKKRFLFCRLETERYCFMQTLDQPEWESKPYFSALLCYDKKENKVWRQRPLGTNDHGISLGIDVQPYATDENIAVGLLQAYVLRENYEAGLLTGNQKEIASRLSDDSNPVLVIMKFKE